MSTILDLVRRLLPQGSNGFGNWKSCPSWPPDAFAVAATLARLSGCYSRIRVSRSSQSLQQEGIRWRLHGVVPKSALECWKVLIRDGSRKLSAVGSTPVWWTAALELVAIADEASRGMGFVLPAKQLSLLAKIVLYENWRYVGKLDRTLKNVPHSLCLHVPKSEACVQPKSRTPQVGCTVNALSHHLALLPPEGEIPTFWQQGVPGASATKPLNLLLVPFPYRIDDEAFVVRRSKARRGRYFSVEPTWMRGVSASLFAEFLRDLIRVAARHTKDRRIDGVILPEGALEFRDARRIAEALAPERLEFFISGASRDSAAGPQNLAYSAFYDDNSFAFDWWQSKRHRWKLEKYQIDKYGLKKRLQPYDHPRGWWEDIDIGRTDGSQFIRFTVFRSGATMAVLICEDLARVEPVQPVLRAIGPNLVIVPLLDGAQKEHRWSDRYAMALADDPGSAVLTLTAVGMIRREVNSSPSIGLWRDPSAPKTRELMLPWGSHALLLKIDSCGVKNWSLDSRSDLGSTVSLSLSEAVAITHPGARKFAPILR